MAASYTRDDLRAAAGNYTFERGEDHLDAVVGLEVRGGALHATVHGRAAYVVRLGIGTDGLDGSCTCSDAADGAFCVHMVAVGLAKLAGVGSGGGDDPAERDLRGYLEGLEHSELVELLLDAAAEDEQLVLDLLPDELHHPTADPGPGGAEVA